MPPSWTGRPKNENVPVRIPREVMSQLKLVLPDGVEYADYLVENIPVSVREVKQQIVNPATPSSSTSSRPAEAVAARVEEGDELAEAMPEPPAAHPTPRRRTEAELRAEVLSPEHLRLHLPKNAYCKFYMAKERNSPRRPLPEGAVRLNSDGQPPN